MLKLSKAKRAKGELRVPSDKSISHRAVIFSALAEGESYVKEWLSSEDTLATLNMLIALGVEVKKDGKSSKDLTHPSGANRQVPYRLEGV